MDEDARRRLAERRAGRKPISAKEMAERNHKKEAEMLENEIMNLVQDNIERSMTESLQSSMKGGKKPKDKKLKKQKSQA